MKSQLQKWLQAKYKLCPISLCVLPSITSSFIALPVTVSLSGSWSVSSPRPRSLSSPRPWPLSSPRPWPDSLSRFISSPRPWSFLSSGCVSLLRSVTSSGSVSSSWSWSLSSPGSSFSGFGPGTISSPGSGSVSLSGPGSVLLLGLRPGSLKQQTR